jgi:hypothetical protein
MRSAYPAVYSLTSGDPSSSLCLQHEHTGRIYPYRTAIFDSGSNLTIMSAAYCRRVGIQWSTDGGTSMVTSSGQSCPTHGRVTTPLLFTMRKGDGKHEVSVALEVQVVDSGSSTYDVILGTPFMNALATFVHVPTSTLCYYPRWLLHHDQSIVSSIPIATTTDHPTEAYRRTLEPMMHFAGMFL